MFLTLYLFLLLKKKKKTRGLKEDTNCVADGVNNNYAVRQKRMLPGTSVLNPKK